MASSVNFAQQQYFGFDPRTAPACALWLDGADSNAMVLSGSTVTTWRDKSGNARDATSVGSPTLTTGALNGLSVVTFNGSTQYMTCPLSLGSTQPLTMFVVARSTTLTGFRAAVSLNGVPGARGSSLMLYLSGTSRWWFSGGNGPTDGNQTTLVLSTTRFDINANYWRPSFVQMNINGTAYASSSATPTSLVANSTMIIGRAQGGIEYWSGPIAEILVYSNTLTSTQREQVEGYLALKWGLQSNFPNSHPFRRLAPVMRLFQPVDVEGGALLWLDAADTRTITGSPITLWTDKSGRGSNATTGTGSVVAGDPINGLNTVRLGLNNRLYLSNFVMPSAQTSVFYVFRGITTNPNPAANTGYFIFSRTVDNFSAFSGNEQFAAYQNPGISRAYILLMGPGGERSWSNAPAATFFNATNVVSTTGVSYGSVNGLSWALFGTSNVSNTVFTASTYQLSTSRSCCGDVFTYDLGELIVCDGTVPIPAAQQIEGYLARKWGVRNSLPTTHPYYSVLPSTALFTPTSISNCALWFDAADTTTITGTTQVTVWSNKGTLGGNATPLTGSCTSGNIANGLNFVRCPAGTDLQFTAALNTQARTWFFVARKTPALPGASTFSAIVGQPGVSGQDAVVLVGVNATTTEIGNGPAAIRPGVLANSPSATLANVFMGCIVHSTVLANNRQTVNGTVLTLTNSTAASSFATGSLTYLLGGRAGYNQSIDLMEVIFYYGALTEAQRQTVEGYLAWKWGLQSLLPSTHTHAKFRP